MTDIFQAIKIADDLESAALTTLESWWPVYIRELEILHSAKFPLNSLPLPRSYITAERLDRENADQLPAVVAVSPGLSGRAPKQEGDGSFRCFFSLGIGVFVAAPTRADTKRLVRVYTAIARTIMLQKQSLGGYAAGTTWLDESYDDAFDFNDTQTIGVGQAVFEVTVDDVVNRYGGPAVYGGVAVPDPDNQPGSDWPLVDTTVPAVTLKGDA